MFNFVCSCSLGNNCFLLLFSIAYSVQNFATFQGKQGPVEHIFRGVLFIYDRHHLEHAGFICVKSENCMMVGGSRANGDRNVWILISFPSRVQFDMLFAHVLTMSFMQGNSLSRFSNVRTPTRAPPSPMRPPRGGHSGFNNCK